MSKKTAADLSTGKTAEHIGQGIADPAGPVLFFECDYQEGVHPLILQKLAETNMDHTLGYGADPYTERAKEKIRSACGAPEAEVQFLVGGTQVNAVVISALLKSYEGVLAASSGHVSVHEAGAIEYTGHKVLTLPETNGKISAAQIETSLRSFLDDGNRDHMVWPGMVYLSQPTEYGTLYSRTELEEIRNVCSRYGIRLYVDGARLAYALACPENDISLADLARLTDVFYIGGTKCGALFGEAVVVPDPALIPHFLTIVKQHGALLAKGRILGLQFGTLFTDGLYERIGMPAIREAGRIRAALREKGYRLCWENPTNQVFVIMENKRLEELNKNVASSFWERYDHDHTVIRLATSWATIEEDVEKLIGLL